MKVPLTLIALSMMVSCNLSVIPNEHKILVVQEVVLRNGESLFWFRDQVQITNMGISYFQVAKDKCKLSVDSANASCESAELILNFENDTVFILSRSPLNYLNPLSGFSLKQIQYEHHLYDVNKKPDYRNMYSLDEVCK